MAENKLINNRASLWKNKDKKGADSPDYKGRITLGGKEYWLSAWENTDKINNRPDITLSVGDEVKVAG